MELMYLVLGALLSVGGGLLAQRQEQVLRQQRDEEEILLEANDILLKLHCVLSQADYALAADSLTPTLESLERKLELLNISDRLTSCAIRMKRSEHRDIAVRLTKLALDPPLRSKTNVSAVTRQVQLRLNPKMINRYESEISARPEDF